MRSVQPQRGSVFLKSKIQCRSSNFFSDTKKDILLKTEIQAT